MSKVATACFDGDGRAKAFYDCDNFCETFNELGTMTSNVSLVIPTFNRPKFLQRQLSYYRRAGFSGEILLADSSSDECLNVTSQWLREFSAPLSVRHFHLPGQSAAAAIGEVRGEVNTPYVAVIPDDDFLVPLGIKQCAAFLDEHKDYVAAHGFGILIESADGRPDRINTARRYRQPVLSDDLASDRVLSCLRNYAVTVFSVHRAETWAKVFEARPSEQENALCCDRSFSDEMLLCTLTAAYGKIAQIDCFYLVRQGHNARNFFSGWYRWLTNEKWWHSYLWYRDKVAAAICEVDGISLQCARDAVETGLAEYLRQWVELEEREELTARIRETVKRFIPEVSKAAIRRFRPRFQSKYISLEGLMDPASSYHRDFLQIYAAVTRTDSDLLQGN